MSFEEAPNTNSSNSSSPNHYHQNQLSELLDHDSVSLLPSFLDELTNYDWWAQDETYATPPATTPPATSATTSAVSSPSTLPQPQLSKKRKANTNPSETLSRTSSGRKVTGKSTGVSSSIASNNKDVRWAEQLLNPCAMAIETCNLSRAQHLIYVIQELASISGDVNHRLAYHGLRVLSLRLLSNGGASSLKLPPCDSPIQSFASTEAKLFRSALIKFHEVSPWFTLPNSLANSAIVQSLSLDRAPARAVHVIDLGVSHGIQWPILLEALTRLPTGAPPLVRLTIAGSTVPPGPFSEVPPEYCFLSHLHRYARSINLNLCISHVDALTAQDLALESPEKLIVCAQFRIGEHTDVLRQIRELKPDLFVLSELEGGESSGGFPARFAERLEMLWKFLDSTSAAFKGRDCMERKVMEGEAARVLDEAAIEGRERWRERMVGLGFREEGFGEEAVEAAKSLLRKYDSNWEMRLEETVAAAVGLRWKGEPVSFCSLWRCHVG